MNIRDYYLDLPSKKKFFFAVLCLVIVLFLVILICRLHKPGPERGTRTYLKNLKSEIPEKRIDAVLLLTKTESKKVVPSLIEVLKSDNNQRVRRAAAWGIASLDRETFISLFHNPQEEIRKVVLETAERREDSRSFLSYFLKALKDKELEIRKVALSSLGKIRDPSSVEPLLNFAKNRNEDLELRKESLKILGSLGDISIKRDLEELAYYEPEIREEVKKALEKIKDSL